MPFTAAQLSAYYTGLTGTAPDQATQVLFQAYAQQNANSSLSDAQTLALVFNAPQVQATFEVAVSTYQFFTGTTLSGPGIQFLRGDAGAGNTNGLNSAYYAQFNTENRYYNFAINLATGAGAGATSFAATYGTTSITPTTAGGLSPYIQAVYETIIGSSNVGTAAANAAITDITSRLAFFQNIAATRGGDATALTNPNGSIILKAVIAGYILEEANKADVGTYAKAIDQFEASIAAGNAIFGPGQNLITNYSQGGTGFNTGVGSSSSNTGGSNGGGAGTNLTVNVETLSGTTFNGGLFFNAPSGTFLQTLNTGDILNGTGTTGATLSATVNGNGAVGAVTVTPTLNNIGTVNLTNLAPGGVILDLSGSQAVKSVSIAQATSATTIQNNAGALTSLSVSNTGGFATTVTSSGTALAGTADTLALTSNASPTGNNVVVANGYEIINLNAAGVTGASATTNTTVLNDANLTTLNITGAAGTNVSLVGSTFIGTANTGVTTINAGGTAASGTTAATAALTGTLAIGSLAGGAGFTAATNTIGQTGGVVTPVVAPVGLGASNLTYIGSNGVDTLTLAAGLNTADNLNGNGGADVLNIVVADNPTAALNVTNFATVQFYAPATQLANGAANAATNVFAGSTTINRANFGATSATTLNLGAATAETQSVAAGNTLTVTNLQTGNTVGFDYDAGTETLSAAGVVTAVAAQSPGNLTVALATDTAADTATINFRDTDVVSTFGTTATMALLTATGVETLNINATGGVGAVNVVTAGLVNNLAQQNNDTLVITAIQDTAVSQMTIKATTNLTLNSTGATVLTNLTQIDASASTGNITLGAVAATPGTALGTQFTTVNTGANISTGSGNDAIVLDVGATGILRNIVLGGDYFGFTANTPGTTAAAAAPAGVTTVVAPLLNDFGNFLALQTTTASITSGITQVDLSSTTDQIIQLLGATNTAAGQVQTGIDSIDLSGLSNGGTGNTATIVGNGNANFIVATAGADTISAGAGNDIVQGGGGADNINVGTGQDTIRYVAQGDSTNAGGVFVDGATTATFDIVTGIVKGDRADFSVSNVLTGATTTTLNGGVAFPVGGTATPAGVAFLTGAAGTDALVRGTYNSAAQTFTAAAGGNDYLYQHDTNGGTAGGVIDIVLVGSAAAGITQVVSSGNGFYTFG